MTDTTVTEGGQTIFPGISSRAFEHPADRAALTAMRSIPGFDQFLRLMSGMLRERQYRLAYLASAVRVGPRQFPDLHALLGEVSTVLDVAERPELFVYNHPVPNAVTLGVDRAFIAMSSSLYELTDHDERRVVLGHELGHVMSGHALYKSVLAHLLHLAASFSWVPAGGLGLRALIAALREWDRKSELSGDRAGLLATQDLDACLRVHMKTAGGAHLDRIDIDAFLEQAGDYERAGDLRDGVLKLLNTENTTHPWSVVRAAEINRWSASEEYRDILGATSRCAPTTRTPPSPTTHARRRARTRSAWTSRPTRSSAPSAIWARQSAPRPAASSTGSPGRPAAASRTPSRPLTSPPAAAPTTTSSAGSSAIETSAPTAPRTSRGRTARSALAAARADQCADAHEREADHREVEADALRP